MKTNFSSYVIFAFLAVAVLICVQASEASSAEDTNKVDKRGNFFVGSRYGRSPQQYDNKARLTVVPRNDRFFLGSRYGKRSGEYMSPVFEQDSSNRSNLYSDMSCTYTGFQNFYRCTSMNEINSFIDKLSREETNDVRK